MNTATIYSFTFLTETTWLFLPLSPAFYVTGKKKTQNILGLAASASHLQMRQLFLAFSWHLASLAGVPHAHPLPCLFPARQREESKASLSIRTPAGPLATEGCPGKLFPERVKVAPFDTVREEQMARLLTEKMFALGV